MQKAFVFDINKCTGCQACQVACEIENVVAPDVSWRQVTTFNPEQLPGIPSFHLSLACNHCIDPPCMKSCPANAYEKDTVTGAVTIDGDLCVGCHYCAWACPYDAPQFNRSSGTMEKCTFCSHRLAEGFEPACVTSCPTGALELGDYDGVGNGDRPPGFPASAVVPAIAFVPLAPGRRQPEAAVSGGAEGAPRAFARAAEGKITLRSEWALVVFTLIASFLPGVFVALRGSGPWAGAAYGLAGVAGMALATMHLGRRERAWRAILNWRRSWLSREMLLFPAFLGLSTLYLVAGGSHPAAFAAIVVLGFAALYAMDRVYTVTATSGLWMHSARVVLTAAFMAGVLSGSAPLATVAGAAKLASYVWRKVRLAGEHGPLRPLASAARVLVGLGAPAVGWGMAGNEWIVVACVLIGEVVDRCEFYLELDIPTARRQGERDLRRSLSPVSNG